MTPEQHQKQKLKYYARRIIRDIKNDVPDVILALNIMLLWQCAEATIGKELYEEVARKQIENARQRCGLCQDCPNEVNSIVTHPPVCERCDMRREKEAAEMDAGMEEFNESDELPN